MSIVVDIIVLRFKIRMAIITSDAFLHHIVTGGEEHVAFLWYGGQTDFQLFIRTERFVLQAVR